MTLHGYMTTKEAFNYWYCDMKIGYWNSVWRATTGLTRKPTTMEAT